MAEGLWRRELAKKVGALEVQASSAGVDAAAGAGASVNAVTVDEARWGLTSRTIALAAPR